MPDSAVNVLLLAAAFGFPLALIFGWQFDISTSGITRTAPAKTDVDSSSLRLTDYALLTVLLAASVAIVYGLYGRLEETASQAAAERAIFGLLDKAASIAVLPFEDLSPGQDQAFFSDGMHDELIGQLSRIGAFRVPSKQSVLPYRVSNKTIPEIASELEVSTILTGSVRHDGDRVRISVRLIDGVRDDHLWVHDYDKELSMQALFEIQSDVAHQIATALNRELTDKDLESLGRPKTESLQAYNAYLKGRYEFAKLTINNLAAAQEHFEEAIRLDPDFAAAYAQLGWLYAYHGTDYGTMPPAEAFLISEVYAKKALELDPTAGRSHELLASIHLWYRWDPGTAEKIFRSATELSPKDWSIYTGYAYYLSALGRHDEAIAAADRAIALDPNNQNVYSNAAWRHLNAGDIVMAIEMAEKALAIDPDFVDPDMTIGHAKIMLGQYDEAIELFMEHGNWVMAGYAQGLKGDTEDALRKIEHFEARSETQYTPAHWLAILYTGIGDYDKAFEKLDDAIGERNRAMLFLDVEHLWEQLRADPRYQALKDRIVPLEDGD